MLNALWKDSLDATTNVHAMLDGHYVFLQANTGLTIDATKQHYVLNPEKLLSNNRHFIARTQMEYQPNGDATTEGQALQIIGLAHAYMATDDPKFLTEAVKCFDAYVDIFYAGESIPGSPQRWIANWIANGKEPVLANWPINSTYATHSGYKCVPVRVVNGQTQIPHGAPFWGEYLDVATYAHRGYMAWEAINGGVREITSDVDWDDLYDNYRITDMPEDPTSQLAWIDWPRYLGSSAPEVNWNNDADLKLIENIICWTGDRIGVRPGNNDELWGGDILESGLPESEFGKIQFRDHNLNGVYLLNYAVRLPVEHGGYLLDRNEVWHNRPVNVPLLGGRNARGNAADAELWFLDACWILWKITGENRYKKAFDSVMVTIEEYTHIDSFDKYFRKTVDTQSPFTDGISYDWAYPETQLPTYSRTEEGWVRGEQSAAAQTSLEQQAIWFKVGLDSNILTTVSGAGVTGKPVNVAVDLFLSEVKSDAEENLQRFRASLPSIALEQPGEFNLKVRDFVAYTKPNGEEYVLADIRSAVGYGDAEPAVAYDETILDSRKGSIVSTHIPDNSSGLIIGFWLQPNEQINLSQLTYKADSDLYLRIKDVNNWSWQTVLNQTNSSWITRSFTSSQFTLSETQGEDVIGSTPTPLSLSGVKQVEIAPVSGDATFAYYCINDVPPTCNLATSYTMKYRITFSCDEPHWFEIGDCTATDIIEGTLAYTPGVIPFSNIYNVNSNQFDGWHGMPYPGYQYPFIYLYPPTGKNYTTELHNMTDFLYDSQQSYFEKFGELGPGMSAYVWNRWDNLSYGQPDTFVFTHWGGGHAWAGYQPRAYAGAARAWYELVISGKPVPNKLREYVENWSNWLYRMQKLHGISPTDWTIDGKAVFDPTDFTGHMAGLWLAGASYAYLAGSKQVFLPQYIEMMAAEIQANYINTGRAANVMNGGWSPGLRLNTGDGPESNAMFFGFWSGEILRGLGMYLMTKKINPLESMYGSDKEPDIPENAVTVDGEVVTAAGEIVTVG